MRRFATMLALVSVVVGLWAAPGYASWVTNNCYEKHSADSYYRRTDAKAYASIARGEGYEWGGGCWNNNDVDDTPNAPDSGGEGPDCSGFTFKTWELRSQQGTSGFTWWHRMENIHGPYASSEFHDPQASFPFFRLANKWRSTTLYMDAFAKIGHIGLIWSDTVPSDGGDYIVQGKGDAWGTDVWREDFRADPAYAAVRREGWTPDCYPNCGAPASPTVAVP